MSGFLKLKENTCGSNPLNVSVNWMINTKKKRWKRNSMNKHIRTPKRGNIFGESFQNQYDRTSQLRALINTSKRVLKIPRKGAMILHAQSADVYGMYLGLSWNSKKTQLLFFFRIFFKWEWEYSRNCLWKLVRILVKYVIWLKNDLQKITIFFSFFEEKTLHTKRLNV